MSILVAVGWFPSLSSWLKALGLLIPAWMGSVAPLSLHFWIFLILIPTFTDNPTAPPEALFIVVLSAAFFLSASLIWYLLLILLYRLFLRLLWSEVPQVLRWLKPPTKKRDILFGWLAIAASTLIAGVPFALPLFAYYYKAIYAMHLGISPSISASSTETIDVPSWARVVIPGWYVVTAYFYHLRSKSVIRRRTNAH